MRIPIIRGIIDRRILVNYRVDADVLAKVLPPPFRPHVIHGAGMAGICLIRLKSIRPRFLPGLLGLASENAAHRMAVEWDEDGEVHQGVYIPRRDTSSRWNALAGGRLFPGVHHHARFQVEEREGHYRVILDSDDGETHLAVAGSMAPELPAGSVFRCLEEASDFFEAGSLGYSDTAQRDEYDGLELRSFGWKVHPLEIERVESSFFENPNLFPQGSVEFDCALLMLGIEHEWHSKKSLKPLLAADAGPAA